MTMSTVAEVDLVAAEWVTALDFYEALLAALGAPEWHGRNVNALMDSMIFGGINKIDPPMVVRISRLNDAGEAARDACEHGELIELEASHWVPEDVPREVNTHIEQFLQKEFVEDE